MDFSRFNIIWIESCTYPCESVISNHKHNFFHYIYCISGIGNITIGNKQYEFHPDNIYMVPPLVEHTFSNSGNSQLKTIEIKFSIENLETQEALKSLPFCVNAGKNPTKSILLAMYEEHYYKRYLSTTIIELNFKLLLSHLLRNGDYIDKNQIENCVEERFCPEIDKVVKYIYENLSEDLSLKKLSEIAGFEKKYFSRKFNKIKKQTPVNFVKQTRIKKAKELLRYSDMNITQIAEATGFKSIHYFSKQFFESTGIRPLSYKNSFK